MNQLVTVLTSVASLDLALVSPLTHIEERFNASMDNESEGSVSPLFWFALLIGLIGLLGMMVVGGSVVAGS